MLTKSRGASLILALFVSSATPLCAFDNKDVCSIEGVVRVAGSRMPLPGVEVILSSNSNKATESVIVTSDADGHYFMGDLEPGRYSLVAERDGYVTQTYGQRKSNREGKSLMLEPGNKLMGIDFGLVPTGVITGRVLGEDYQPRVGAYVEALAWSYVHGRRQLLTEGLEKTNDLGEYRIYGVGPGRYYVFVAGKASQQGTRPPRGSQVDKVYVSTFYPNASEFDDAKAVDVLPGGETRSIDVTTSKMRAFHVRGRILGFDSAAEYCRVQIRATAIELGGNVAFRGGEISTDAQGNFDFGGIVSGSYVVSTSIVQKGTFKTAWRNVRVGDGDTNEVNLVPAQRLDLQGRVRVEGEKGLAFGQLRVELSDQYSPLERSSFPVNSDGSFLLRGVERYVYRVGVSGLPENFYLKSVRLGDQDIVGTTVDLSGQTGMYAALEVVISGAGGKVEGTVKDEKGTPVSGGTVALVPDSSRRNETNPLFKSATADDSGRFSIRGIRPGNYKLFAWDDIEEGAWYDPQFLQRYEGRGEEITIDSNGHIIRDLAVIPVDSE